jgi:hypothetical protein
VRPILEGLLGVGLSPVRERQVGIDGNVTARPTAKQAEAKRIEVQPLSGDVWLGGRFPKSSPADASRSGQLPTLWRRQHRPLNRQGTTYAREGIALGVSRLRNSDGRSDDNISQGASDNRDLNHLSGRPRS